MIIQWSCHFIKTCWDYFCSRWEPHHQQLQGTLLTSNASTWNEVDWSSFQNDQSYVWSHYDVLKPAFNVRGFLFLVSFNPEDCSISLAAPWKMEIAPEVQKCDASIWWNGHDIWHVKVLRQFRQLMTLFSISLLTLHGITPIDGKLTWLHPGWCVLFLFEGYVHCTIKTLYVLTMILRKAPITPIDLLSEMQKMILERKSSRIPAKENSVERWYHMGPQ